MAKPKIAKSKRPEAERASEWYLREVCGCLTTRRALRTKFAKVDFMACDAFGVKIDGTRVWVQATAGGDGALRVRRRKLEKEYWHPTDKVMVLQLTSTEDPANRRSKLWWFRVHDLLGATETSVQRTVWRVRESAEQVPREWLKAWKEAAP